MRCRFTLIACALIVFARDGSAQDLGFLTSVVKNVRSLSLSLDAAKLGRGSELSGVESKCIFGFQMCGASAEVYVNVGSTDRHNVNYELAVGASYLRALRVTEPSLDLRGSIRTFPRFGVYATAPFPILEDSLRFYFGGTFGISEFWGARAIDSAAVSTPVTAQSFDWGVAGGFSHSTGVFAELAWTARRFAGIDYGREEIGNWPRQINAGGFKVSVGWQFVVEQETPPPDYPGRWTLTKVEGEAPPRIATQRSVRDQTRADAPVIGSVTEEIVTAYLVIGPEGATQTYRLELQTRVLTANANGVTTDVTYPPIAALTGRYDILGETLRLWGADNSVITVFRQDEEIVFRHPGSGRLISFRRLR